MGQKLNGWDGHTGGPCVSKWNGKFSYRAVSGDSDIRTLEHGIGRADMEQYLCLTYYTTIFYVKKHKIHLIIQFSPNSLTHC